MVDVSVLVKKCIFSINKLLPRLVRIVKNTGTAKTHTHYIKSGFTVKFVASGEGSIMDLSKSLIL